MAKIIRRVWTSEGPTGKRVRHVRRGWAGWAGEVR